MNSKRGILLTAVIAGVILFVPHAEAATITWDGGGITNNWSEAANWSGNVVPAIGDDVLFNGTSVKNSTWDVNGPAQIITLNVNASYTGTLTMGRDVAISAEWNYAGASFSAGVSTITFVGAAGGDFIPGTVSYANINIGKANNGSLYVTGTGMIQGNLIISGIANEIQNGTLEVRGNILITPTDTGGGGNGIVKITGTGVQTLSSGGGTLPYVEINKPSGTLTLAGYIGVARDWTWVAGSISAGTSTIAFRKTSGEFTPGNATYANIEVARNPGGTLYVMGTATTTGDLIISGDSNEIAIGTLNIAGDVIVTQTGSGGGTATVGLMGSGAQTISSSGGGWIPSIRIQKPAGTLTLMGTIPLAKDWTWISGAVNVGTSTLKFVGPLTPGVIIGGPIAYYNIIASKPAANYRTLYEGDLTIANALTVTSGEFGHVAADMATLEVQAISIASAGTWSDLLVTTTTVKIGSGGVVNNGAIRLNGGGGGCAQYETIFLRSSTPGVRRTWSGSGTFSVIDTDVKDQGGVVTIRVVNGFDAGNNGANWIFDNDPPGAMTGSLISSVIDGGRQKGGILNSIMWQGKPITGLGESVKFHIASSNAMAGPWNYMGPDGTAITYYGGTLGAARNSAVKINPANHNNHRYLRYKVILESDACRSVSPYIDDIILNWSP